jgi:hypothetical protein
MTIPAQSLAAYVSFEKDMATQTIEETYKINRTFDRGNKAGSATTCVYRNYSKTFKRKLAAGSYIKTRSNE